MEQIRAVLQEGIGKALYQIILSNPRNKAEVSKCVLRPVMIGDTLKIQESRYVGQKVYHKNLSENEAVESVLAQLEQEFKQLEMQTTTLRVTALVSKKGKVTVKKKQVQGDMPDLSHNRTKQYILKEGTLVGFLIDLGVQTEDGKIVRRRYDKFKQINRFLEFIEDILPILPRERTVHIVDFGCGKSYLTFAMYYYLKELKGYDVRITGLDLKEDVIETCNRLSVKYGYDGLSFERGDISTFHREGTVDMVVTLHACDTATDYALHQAVEWGSSVILSVPCCQHELNRQITNEMLNPVLKYGILKERMAALLTDGIRAQLLEQMGYETQLLEFIDMEHTPKNILIRAVKKRGAREEDQQLRQMIEELHLKPTLDQLLNKK